MVCCVPSIFSLWKNLISKSTFRSSIGRLLSAIMSFKPGISRTKEKISIQSSDGCLENANSGTTSHIETSTSAFGFHPPFEQNGILKSTCVSQTSKESIIHQAEKTRRWINKRIEVMDSQKGCVIWSILIVWFFCFWFYRSVIFVWFSWLASATTEELERVEHK